MRHILLYIFRRSTLDLIIIFILTYMAYALLHANRKAFGNLKPAISQAWTPTIQNSSDNVTYVQPVERWSRVHFVSSEEDAAKFFGLLDSLFMASYAIGLYVSGWIGDRLDHRWMLTFGLTSSSAVIFIFGVLNEWTHFYNKYFYIFLWICNGLLQSTVWPSAVAIMNLWFENYRGLVIGMWSSCASFGNIIGDLVIGAVVSYGYEYGFLVLSTSMFGFAFLVFFGLLPHPSSRDSIEYKPLNTEESADIDPLIASSSQSSTPHLQTAKTVPFFRILCQPDVFFFSVAYACIKLVNYGLFFWLTFYLTRQFGWSNSTASTFSVWYDVGGIIGGIFAGLVSDLVRHISSRRSISLILSFIAVPALLGYRFTPGEPMWANGIMMCVAGFFVGGPAVLISAVVIGDLCANPIFRGARTQATVAGIIDGTGSVGAAVGQILVPYLAYRYKWSVVFYFFIVCMILTIISLIPTWFRHRRVTVPVEESAEQLHSAQEN